LRSDRRGACLCGRQADRCSRGGCAPRAKHRPVGFSPRLISGLDGSVFQFLTRLSENATAVYLGPHSTIAHSAQKVRDSERTAVAPASLVTNRIATMKTNQASQLFGGSLAAARGNLEAQFESGACFSVPINVINTSENSFQFFEIEWTADPADGSSPTLSFRVSPRHISGLHPPSKRKKNRLVRAW
jgi:hypothetical protein